MAELGSADRSAVYTGKHQELVHGEKVRPESSLSGALNPKFLERYLVRWRRIYRDEWLADSGAVLQANEPSALELIRDRLFYGALRAYDFGVIVAFCFAPIKLWKRYRALKAAHGGAEQTHKFP
jgi:hypothetical protein